MTRLIRSTLFIGVLILLLECPVLAQAKACPIPEFDSCVGIRIQKLKRVRGRVIDHQGALIPDSCIAIYDRNLVTVAATVSDENGLFAIGRLKNGHYVFVAQYHGLTPIRQEIIIDNRRGRSAALKVHLVPLETDSCSYAR